MGEITHAFLQGVNEMSQRRKVTRPSPTPTQGSSQESATARQRETGSQGDPVALS